MVPAPAGLVIIQADWRQPVVPGSIQPHVGLGLCCFPVLLQHLAGRFIRMDDIPLQQMFMKPFIYRLHVVQAAFDDPVGQCCPPELYPHLFPVRFLTVKRDAVHIFPVHYIRDSRWGRKAVLQQRARCLRTNDNGSAVFFAFRAAKHFLYIPDPFHFRGDDPQLIPDDLFSMTSMRYYNRGSSGPRLEPCRGLRLREALPESLP